MFFKDAKKYFKFKCPITNEHSSLNIMGKLMNAGGNACGGRMVVERRRTKQSFAKKKLSYVVPFCIISSTLFVFF